MAQRRLSITIADGRSLYLDEQSLDKLAFALFQEDEQSELKLIQETDNTWDLVIENRLRCPLNAASLDSLGVVFSQWKEPPTDNYLSAAIECWSKSIALTSDSDPKSIPRHLDLSDSYRTRYNRRQQDADLGNAVRMIEWAENVITPSHEYYSNFLSIYGELACLDASLLNRAISYFEISRGLMEVDLKMYQLFGNVLYRRYDRQNDLNDLKAAILVSEEIAGSNGSAKIRLYAFASLAQWYGQLYGRDHHPNLLDQGVQGGIEAKALALNELSGVSSDAAYAFGALATAFRCRYEYLGKRTDLDNALLYGEQAKKLANDTDSDKPKWLNNLGLTYEFFFEATGDMDKLELAIESSDAAFQLTPRRSQQKLHILNNRANQLGRRYDWTFETEYLDNSIQWLEEVIHYEEQSSSERAAGSQNLGLAYLERFSRKGISDDLDKCIEMFNKAIDYYTEGDASIPVCYCLLGLAYEKLYEIPGFRAEEELIKANKYYERAISLCKEGHIHQAYNLGKHGLFYARQFHRHGNNIDDLEKAVKLTKEALKLLPIDTPMRGEPLIVLGSIFRMIYWINKDPGDLARALEYYQEILAMPNGHPLLRIKAARFAIRLLNETNNWNEMKLLGETAMSLLPFVCGRYQRLHDQQQALLHTAGLAADFCSILLKMGHPEEALRKLEFGKGLVIGYNIDNRDDLTALRASRSDLAEKYENLRRGLYLPPDEPELHITGSHMRGRRNAAREMESCLKEIQQTEGHGDFLKELPVDQMMTCAKEGPIVVVNITDISSNAILISTSRVHAISLPDIKPGSIPDFILNGIVGFVPDDQVSSRGGKLKLSQEQWLKSMGKEDSLAWLWRTCVKVVLDELKIAGMISVDGLLPRIWWMGSGVASSFPFHAAGSNFKKGEDTLSQSIPSYTLSIKALQYSRQRSQKYQQSSPAKPKVTVVTMATTPGHAALSGVSQESSAIEDACKNTYTYSALTQPDVKLALESVADSEIMHFACHGVSDIRNPVESHLILQKKNENFGTVIDKLSVSRILAVEGGWISYLSACSTAEIRASELADEGLHISSALQLAGFAHVIGSIWPVDDTVCVDVASSFYKNLIAKRGQQPRNRAVAEALREAILYVRSRHLEPWKWAAYIHSGA